MIYDLISENISELSVDLESTQNILKDLIKNHLLEEHKTKGEIKVIADELIKSLEGCNDSDENK